MGVFEMVVLVVLISMVASLLRTWIKSRAVTTAPADDARLRRLEERVQALEEIVGDSSFELKQRFRELQR